jgi:hypothetical protein
MDSDFTQRGAGDRFTVLEHFLLARGCGVHHVLDSLGLITCVACPRMPEIGSLAAAMAGLARRTLNAAGMALVCAPCSSGSDSVGYPRPGLLPPSPYVPEPEAILALVHGSEWPALSVFPDCVVWTA